MNQQLRRSKYQIFPAHPFDRHEALEQSVLAHGVETATTWDDEGNLLDGWERESICQAQRLGCPREVRHFDAEADKFRFVLTVNAHRRPCLSSKQKRAVIEAYLLGDPEMADNTLGQSLGVSKNTVLKARRRLEARGKITKVKMTRGKDGKLRPVKYAKRIITNSPSEFKKALEIIKDLPNNCDGKTVDINTAKRRAAKNRNKEERESRIVPPLPDDAIRLYHCRFQKLEMIAGLAPSSTNLILTDIPYGREFLAQVEDLGALAKRVLVESGLLVTMCGHYWLYKVMDALSRHLTYRWMNASVWIGKGNPIYIGGRKEPKGRIISRWKPILVYSKGCFPKRGQWCDVLNVNSKEKQWHPWQQPLKEFQTLVRYFSDRGDLVVDPCGGGFTTAEACLGLGRRCISCDIEGASVKKGWQRLHEARQLMRSKTEA